MWSISVTLFYLNYIIRDDLCRQFQSEALRLGFWPMNLVVPEAHFSPQHLSLDLRCSQIKTIDHLLSIPAGFPTAFELRHTPLLKPETCSYTAHLLRYSGAQSAKAFFLHSSLSHIFHTQSVSNAAPYASKLVLHSAISSSSLKESSEFGL